MDIYQKRYLAHQKRKSLNILGYPKQATSYGWDTANKVEDVVSNRRSHRVFDCGKIDSQKIRVINSFIDYAPSSCNRKGITSTISYKLDYINDLVGGKGWADKATLYIEFKANMTAYKSPNEVGYMPYLDTGFIAQNVYIACTVLNLRSCFINPNGVKLKHPYLLTGVMAIGK